MTPTHRADHVGSLLRPPELLSARKDPNTTHERLTAVEDRCILDALKRQQEVGLTIFTDGELRRTSFMGDFYESVDGLDQDYDVDRTWKGGAGLAKGIGARGGAFVGKIRQTKRLTRDDESERSGTFEALRFVPKSKSVVLGLVSSKLPEPEPQEHLLHRIDEASQYVPLENLAVSPQCGFASTMEGNLLTEDDQWRKLQLVVDTARKVWKSA
jgi:methionine synthase II (cobalamin-independent)